MTTAEYKKERKAIKRAFSILKNDKNEARKFLIRIGLLNKNGKPRKFSQEEYDQAYHGTLN